MSYIVNINIHTGNDAFGVSPDSEAAEVARILRELADYLDAHGLDDALSRRLHDTYGNKVGTVRVDPL